MLKIHNNSNSFLHTLLGSSHRDISEKFADKQTIQNITSSYKAEEYFDVLTTIGYNFASEGAHQFGILNGFSFFAISAGAIASNKNVQLKGFDLFEDYQYNSSSFYAVNKTKQNLSSCSNTELIKARVLCNDYKFTGVLHNNFNIIDLSNCGEIVQNVLKTFVESPSNAIMFEGGSKARDEVTWMHNYNRKPIYEVLEEMSEYFEINVLDIFPSLTIVRKIE